MYLAKTPSILKNSLPSAIWSLPDKNACLYLTFDDGPTPGITPWVLKTLKKYKAKATFFCVGSQVKLFPDIYQQIRAAEHSVGNHTFTHLNGWFSKKKTYLRDVISCTEFVDSKLFRPPYGKLSPSQYFILKEHFKIVMWDVLSGDFDKALSSEGCLQNVLENTESGSIVVFHDSSKSEEKLHYVLPQVLEYYSSKGYSFKALS